MSITRFNKTGYGDDARPLAAIRFCSALERATADRYDTIGKIDSLSGELLLEQQKWLYQPYGRF